ncbi:hypothetical protein BD94_1573 [Elizabethkingia anophelis NUHP1]|uniref:Uncharacterized protein n=1 Tax=Elizabethkingia anophelis NUHP1 TaxID=1338011 RepID=A0A077EFK5_9FLAO|nr:hypothetical protein BD94_1573 [Elizabethkingia anophelis NUHP1]
MKIMTDLYVNVNSSPNNFRAVFISIKKDYGHTFPDFLYV